MTSFGLPRRKQFTAFEHHDPIAILARHIEIVRDDDDGKIHALPSADRNTEQISS